MTSEDHVYVLVAVDKRAVSNAVGPCEPRAAEWVKSWIEYFLFDDQFAVAEVTEWSLEVRTTPSTGEVYRYFKSPWPVAQA